MGSGDGDLKGRLLLVMVVMVVPLCSLLLP
jgi:hypothetical protein